MSVDLNAASVFLKRLAPEGGFTFQTFDDTKAKRREVARILHGSLSEHAPALRALNASQAGVFVTVNETDGEGRHYSNVTGVRALFVDLDGSPVEPIRQLALRPHMLIESSPDRWHAYWCVADCPLEDFRGLQRGLVARFGGDKQCIDLPRVMRLPGFMHQKGEPFQTRLAGLRASDAPYTLDEFLNGLGWADAAAAEAEFEAVRKPAPAKRAPDLLPPASTDDEVLEDLRDALARVDADDYDTWIRMGHALKAYGDAAQPLFLEWSGRSPKFDSADALKRWQGFRPDQTNFKAVFEEAKRCGWDPASSPKHQRRRQQQAPPRATAQPPTDFSVGRLVKDFELVYGKEAVWDCVHQLEMPYRAFCRVVGSDSAKAWMNADGRRTRMPLPPKEKEAKADSKKVRRMKERYSLIYGEEAVFDHLLRREITLGALRAFWGLSTVRAWGDLPDRAWVDQEAVVFDPRRDPADQSICNLWGGWPIEPAPGNEADQQFVQRWLAVLHYVFGESESITDWVLKWIAYPLQHPGQKMRTSVILHGPEGSGKNTVWDAVRLLYGRYGIQVTQTQLESQWNDWMSAKLFIVGNEVLHRQEQVQQKGRLKTLITETQLRVERKFLSGRTEDNFANMVFLSNEERPLSLDAEDRRFMVVWTPPPHPEGKRFYEGMSEDVIPPSSVQALYDYLLRLDLDDFGPHSKPPWTEAKQQLIDASLESHKRFVRDWLAGELPIDLRPTLTAGLYEAYLYWCKEHGERYPKAENLFASWAKKKVHHSRKRYLQGQKPVQRAFYLPEGKAPPPEKSEQAWLAEEVIFFRQQLKQWKDEKEGDGRDDPGF